MRVRIVAAVAASLTLAACTSGSPSAPSSSSVSPSAPSSSPSSVVPPTASSPPVSSSTPAAPLSAARRAFDGMSLDERVGQLIMIDCPSDGVSDATRRAITKYDVGSVILDGNTQIGVDGVSRVTKNLSNLAPKDIGLFVATDQEGGQVQRLQGAGFDTIPRGTTQGEQSTSRLRKNAQNWGEQLRDAGVNVNLAPVLDVVPSGQGSNPPIGDLDRQYGSSPKTVTSHGLAVIDGMAAAGVDTVVKHFPGLGRVTGNTDVASGVTDSKTGSDSKYLEPFRAAIRAKVPFVMMSTAIYRKLDPGTPAAFSKRIVTDLLRKQFGFRGVVVTDDVGAADQVASYSVGQRAVKTIEAGGDMVLTVVADQAETMTEALADKARSSASFRRLVDAAALRVLQAKQARGLLR